MSTEISPVVDAPAVVAEAVSEAYAEGVSTAEEIIEHAVANAEAEAAVARETAERLAAAAVEGERGERILRLENRMEEIWHALADLQSSVARLSEQLTETQTSQAATAGLVIAETLSQSTPQTSPIVADQLETAAEIAEVLPEALSQSDVAESPAPVIVRKARRLI